MIQTLYAIANAIRYRPRKPIRNPAYLRFIRRFPCVGCGKTRGIEAMHTGPHGLGQKADDTNCVPGCRECHREFDRNPSLFATRHGISVEDLVKMFNEYWSAKNAR